MKNYLSLILLLLISNSFAQTNFITGSVTLKDGTVKEGLIDYKDWRVSPKEIKFKNSEGSEIMEYTPEDLQMFSTPDDKYVSKLVTIDETEQNQQRMDYRDKVTMVERQVFLNVLTKGTINLYEYYDARAHYFVSKENVQLTELIYRKKVFENKSDVRILKKYIGQLRFLTNDRPEMNISELLDYKRKSLTKLVLKYNNLNKTGGDDKYEKKMKRSSHFYLTGGYHMAKLKFETTQSVFQDFSGGNLSKYRVGAAFEISLDKSIGKWSLFNELSYSSYSKNFKIERQLLGDVKVDDFHFKVSYVDLSSILRYKFVKDSRKFTPFINAGLGYNLVANSASTFTRENSSSNTEIEHAKSFYLVAGTGVVYKKISLELRYSVVKDVYDSSNLSGMLSNFGLIAAYQFL